MSYRFEFADKANIENLLPSLFEILHSNMSLIAPTGNTYDEDYKIWVSNVFPAMNKPQRQIVLMYSGYSIVGYFQYYVSSELFMMEEIQIEKDFQGTGLFSEFYKWLIRQLPDSITAVEAYSHKNNLKSQGILAHLGLTCIGENKSGNCYHYKGSYSSISEKYL